MNCMFETRVHICPQINAHISIILLKLQTKKIRKELEAYGIHAGGSVAAAPVAAAPVPEAAPPATDAAPKDAAAPGGDRASQLKTEIDQMSARSAEVQRGTVAYSTAQQHLRKAEQELGGALKCLTVTQVSGATETVQDVRIGFRGGRMFGPKRGMARAADRSNDFAHNAIEAATVHKANKLMKDAASEITKAKEHVPQLPFIEMANVSQAMKGVFFNALLAPGMIGNVMQMKATNKAKAQTQEMAQQTKQALDCKSLHFCLCLCMLLSFSLSLYIILITIVSLLPFPSFVSCLQGSVII